MADFNDKMFEREFNNIINMFDNMSRSLNDTSKIQQQFAKEISNYSNAALLQFKKLLIDNEKAFKDSIDLELKARNDRLKELQNKHDEEIRIRSENSKELQNVQKEEIENRSENSKEFKELANEIKEIRNKYQKYALDSAALRENANNENNRYVRDELNKKAEEIEKKQRYFDDELKILELKKALFIENNSINEKALKDAEANLNAKKEADSARDEWNTRAREKQERKQEERVNKTTDIFDKGLRTLTNTFTSASTAITNSYNQYASTLSSSLNTTVYEISDLQKNLAKNLNSEGLGKAISNIQVMAEAASLAASGYTNEAKLQQNATDIEIGQRIAPTLDFNNLTVKNLVNAIGPDFTHRFAAIQSAVQESAGSTAFIASNLTSLIDDLEPVFLNSQYSLDAIQGAGDVSNTLSSAIEQRIISQDDAKRYQSLLLELMDPSRAFNSSNLAVRVASTSEGYFKALESGNPMDFLNLILEANKTYYGNTNMSGSSATDVIGRSYLASVAGDNTFSAAYNPQSLIGVTPVYTRDLSTVYDEQLEKLRSGDYTTAKESIENSAQNSELAQAMASFQKSYPRISEVLLPTIITQIERLPRDIATSLNLTKYYYDSRDFISSPNESTFTNNDIGTTGGIDIATATATGGMGTPYSPNIPKQTINNKSLLSKIKNNKFVSKTTNFLSKRTSGLALMSYGAGISGAINIFNDLYNKDGDNKAFADLGETTSNFASIGAAIGSFTGTGPIGTIIGGAVGGLVGAITSLGAEIHRNTKANEESNKLQEEENKVLNEAGVTKLSKFKSESIVAQGGGTISTSKGIFEIARHATGLDKVPYDNYLAMLHKDEAVVTATAANEYRKTNPNFWNVTNNKQMISSNNEEVVYGLKEQTKSIVDAIRGNDKDNFTPLTINTPKQYKIKNASLT